MGLLVKTIAEGKDLTNIKYIIGTGGALTRLPRRISILRSVLEMKRGLKLYPGNDAKVLIDNDYIFCFFRSIIKEIPKRCFKTDEKSLYKINKTRRIGMNYPALKVNLDKLESNTRLLVEKCAAMGISVSAVTKVFCGMPEIAVAMVKGGANYLADSRIENLKKMQCLDIPKMLLRIPMLSQVEEVVEYADISLNSEYEVMKALSNEAIKRGKVHQIILMVDLGDLREGVWVDEAMDYADKIMELEGIKLIGIGTNLTCYGAVIPNEGNLSKLVEIADSIEKKHNIKLSIISGGNSSSVYLVGKGAIPKGINNLRLGESIVLGNETAYGGRIAETYNDCFTLC